MSFIRPEAIGFLHKHSGLVFASLILTVGIFIIATSYGIIRIVGIFFLIIGVLIGHDAYRRFKFPSGKGGAGLVDVDERCVSYLSAEGGMSISMDTLDRIEVHRNAKGRINWVFYGPEGILSVPGDAEGTSKLFDALVALPGVNYTQAEAATHGKGPDLFLIWQRNRTKLH